MLTTFAIRVLVRSRLLAGAIAPRFGSRHWTKIGFCLCLLVTAIAPCARRAIALVGITPQTRIGDIRIW
ncbi:hypothetical protein [Nostoc sp.]|uniref:hypothetical protein n=1 Tax=Nostoc sp. TaxID=1180 RepID=UPI002FFB0EA4